MGHDYNTAMGFEVYTAANIRIMVLCFMTQTTTMDSSLLGYCPVLGFCE
jgi:hypothetical protein